MKIAQVGEKILRTPAEQVTRFDQALADFVAELMSCMEEAGGIGIAAPQVFDPRAIMIVASRTNARYPEAPDMEPMVLINPEIVEQGGDIVKDWEGCLSVPGLRGLVPRHTRVHIRYQDVTGEFHEVIWKGFLARVFLHEFDHLIGHTWLDRVESNRDMIAESVYLEMMSK